jgi:hypothetical protein
LAANGQMSEIGKENDSSVREKNMINSYLVGEDKIEQKTHWYAKLLLIGIVL